MANDLGFRRLEFKELKTQPKRISLIERLKTMFFKKNYNIDKLNLLIMSVIVIFSFLSMSLYSCNPIASLNFMGVYLLSDLISTQIYKDKLIMKPDGQIYRIVINLAIFLLLMVLNSRIFILSLLILPFSAIYFYNWVRYVNYYYKNKNKVRY